MDLLNALSTEMTSSESAKAIAKKAGIKKNQVSDVVSAALPALLQGLTTNTSSQSGAASLINALSQHTSTDSVADQILNADTNDGSAIINHILGGNTESTVTSIATQAGIDKDKISSVLFSIAPALLSVLSGTTSAVQNQSSQGSGLNLAGLGSLVGNILGGGQSQASSTASSAGGLLGGLSSLGNIGSLFGGGSSAASDGANNSGNTGGIDGSALLSNLFKFMK